MKIFCLVFRAYNLPETELYFNEEENMKNYIEKYLCSDIDYIAFFHNNIDYIPIWWTT